jgi:hypothetical protein
MSTQELHTQAKRCQCAVPTDCWEHRLNRARFHRFGRRGVLLPATDARRTAQTGTVGFDGGVGQNRFVAGHG